MIADCVGGLLPSVCAIFLLPGSQKQAIEFKLPTGANTSAPPPALRSSLVGRCREDGNSSSSWTTLLAIFGRLYVQIWSCMYCLLRNPMLYTNLTSVVGPYIPFEPSPTIRRYRNCSNLSVCSEPLVPFTPSVEQPSRFPMLLIYVCQGDRRQTRYYMDIRGFYKLS